MTDRFTIRERIDSAFPRDTDPKAQAFKRHSGTFDVIDTKGLHVVCTTRDLSKARKLQARWNTLLLPI